MNKKNNKGNIILIIIVILFIFGPYIFSGIEVLFTSISNATGWFKDKSFVILSSDSNSYLDDELEKFAKKNKIKIRIEHAGDLEIVDLLNDNPEAYDAVWISNSIWLYMLDNSYLVSDSKSIAIDPVVMGVQKSKAQELGFTNNIYNKDIVDAIKNKKLKYVMTSVTQTNTGASAYLGFLNALAGSPEVLKEEMLDSPTLLNDLKSFFKGVERVSGEDEYLMTMFKNGKYDAMINYESSIIQLNKELEKEGKEPLYLIYPVDGVAINDMPFGYVEHQQDKKENFKKIQSFLRSKEVRKKLENLGYRSWYGGIKSDANKDVFKKEWGIDTNKYLIPQKYPSKTVMNKAFDIYVEDLRKPTHTVFCLDRSGSMNGSGINELKEAMKYIVNREEARKDRLQFSKEDKITIIQFNGYVYDTSKTFNGYDVDSLINYVDSIYVGGGTNIYDPSIEALKILQKEDPSEYNTVVILMTDGQSNQGSYYNLENFYKNNNIKAPIYSITFGQADESELNEIADLTNGKVFNGKSGLKEAFKEVRSFS
ncbi:MAG: VWA domain-containing protein [Bacilli bacterium]|nr:VWA domain-containing protein [Bacilli bacterium]